MKNSSLTKNISLYTVGQFLAQALSFALLPIYINKLSVSEYGVVAVFMAVGTFLNAIMQYGFSPTLLRYYFDFKDDPKKFNSLFSTLILFLVAGNIAILAILYLIHNYVYELSISGVEVSDYIYYVLGYSFLFTFPLLNLSLFRIKGKAKEYLFFNITQFFISLGVIYYFVVINEEGALGKIKGDFWARVPLFLISFFLYKRYFTLKNLKASYLKASLRFGIPLMLQSLLWWGLYRLDYFLIENQLGSDYLGLYNLSFQISFVIITVGISFSLGWTPHFFSIADKKSTPRLYGNIIGNYIAFITVACIFIQIVGYHVFNVIGGQKYFEIFTFLPWLLVGAIFQSSYYLIHQTIQYSRKTCSIPLILGLGILASFILEYVFIKEYKLFGISIIKILTFGFVFILTFYVGQKHYKIRVPRVKIISAIIILAVNFGIGFFLDYELSDFIIKLLILLSSIVIVLYFLPFFSLREKSILFKKLKLR